MLTDELGALIQDFPIIFLELESNKKVVQGKSYALEVSLWFTNGADFIVNVFETQGFTKSLIINADLQGALIRFLSSFDSRIRGPSQSQYLCLLFEGSARSGPPSLELVGLRNPCRSAGGARGGRFERRLFASSRCG